MLTMDDKHKIKNFNLSSDEDSDDVLDGSGTFHVASDEYMSNDSEEECAVFLCNECGKKFKNGTSLKAHLAKMHNPRALVNCGLCDTKYRGNFSEHLEANHVSLDGDYFCKRCNFISSDYDTIFKHQHVKDFFYICEQCGKMYKSKDNYKFHLLTHNDDNVKKKKEKTYCCDTCGKKFLFAYLLKEHINLHTGTRPYLCKICGCSFTRNASLKRHSAIHNNSVNSFKCYHCENSFFQKIDLRKHMSRHIYEKF